MEGESPTPAGAPAGAVFLSYASEDADSVAVEEARWGGPPRDDVSSPNALGLTKPGQYSSLVPSQSGDERRRVRRAETGDRVPAMRRRIAGNSRVGCVVAGVYVVEIGRVVRSGREVVQKGIDRAKSATLDLGGDRDKPRPLGCGKRCTADVVPAR